MHPHAESLHDTCRFAAASERGRLGTLRWIARRVVLSLGVLGAFGILSDFSLVSASFDTQRFAASPDTRDADAVKSAFVYNFAARHVKWPESAFKDKSSPFVIGVLGDDPIAKTLTATCKDRKSGERSIDVRVIDDSARANECPILFVPLKREAEIKALAASVAKTPVLIVASTEGGVEKGAHIGFYVEKSKVRFAAHPPSAKTAGLEISSELLKLARVVDKQDGTSP